MLIQLGSKLVRNEIPDTKKVKSGRKAAGD